MSTSKKTRSLDDARKKLFQKGQKEIVTHPHPLSKRTVVAPAKWRNEGSVVGTNVARAERSSSFFRNFFIISIVIFLASAAYAFFAFRGGANTVSGENIDIAILGNSFVEGGEPLLLEVEVTNRNSADLELADLLVEYPKGSVGDSSGDMVRIRTSLGTIGSGESASEVVEVVLFGEQGVTRNVRARIEYRVENSNAIFMKEKLFPVTISSAPLEVRLEGPREASSNQEITLVAKVSLNTAIDTSDMRLRVEYPPGFQYRDASPKPVFGETVWSLDDLRQGEEKEIRITGAVFGSEGDERSFRFYAGSENARDQSQIGVVFSSALQTLLIKRSGIETRLSVAGDYGTSIAISPSGTISGQVEWVNNLATRLDDIVIRLAFEGNAFNAGGVSAGNGFYDSRTKTITWDSSTTGELAAVQPGQRGTFSFGFSQLPPAVLAALANPEIRFTVAAEGRMPDGNIVTGTETKTAKIVSDASIAAEVLYSSGPFENQGPVPPQAEKETTYTVTWTVKNPTSQITKAQVRSTLPSYVKFIGTVSPAGEQVSYNESTREVTWNIGTLSRGVGLTSAVKTVSFQVAITPSRSQIGSIPVLAGETVLSAEDVFSGADIRRTAPLVNARLLNDNEFVSGAGIVVE